MLVALLMLVSVINVADAVRSDLGTSDTQLGAVRSAVFLTAILDQLFWEPLSDRWVRKYIL